MILNRYSFLVTWPDDVVALEGLPKSYRVWYPTLTAADCAAEGFRLSGAAVSP